jgi:hypothetical protein
MVGTSRRDAKRRTIAVGKLLALVGIAGSCTQQHEASEAARSEPAAPAPAAAQIQLGTTEAALVRPTTLNAVGDTYVRSGPPDQNSGGDTVLSVEASGARRTLLFFDKPALAAAVGNGRLASAQLELTIYSATS